MTNTDVTGKKGRGVDGSSIPGARDVADALQEEDIRDLLGGTNTASRGDYIAADSGGPGAAAAVEASGEDGGASDEARLKEIADQVAQRVADEEQSYPDVSLNNGKINSRFIEQCMQSGELGLGVFYTQVNKDRLIYNVTAGKWMVFNGVHWVDDDHNQYLYRCEEVVAALLKEASDLEEKIRWVKKKKQNFYLDCLKNRKDIIMKRVGFLRMDKGRNATVKFAISCRDPQTILADNFDTDPWLLGCANGVIDLRSGKFIKGEPGQYINKAARAEWRGIDEDRPLWRNFILDVMGNDGEMYEYMKRLLGYSISGLQREHIMPVFWGKGRNGKGTLINILQHVMGDLAVPVKTELLLYQKMIKNAGGPDPEIVDLKGVRQAFCSETEEGQSFSTSKVKWLTGGDRLVGRNLNEKKLTRFLPTHTMFLMTNYKLNVTPGDDYAIWQRIHLIPFILSYVKKDPEELEDFERVADPDLEDKLKAEASGILAWLVSGFLQYMKYGLNPPKKVRDATLEYQKEEDLLGNFIDGYCLRSTGVETKSSDIFDKFLKWFKVNISNKGISQKRFGSMMKRRFESKKKSGACYYIGIELDATRIPELVD